MTTTEIKTAGYFELIERHDALMAHPEADWRIRDELRAIDAALHDLDLQETYDKVDAEIAAGGMDWMMMAERAAI